MPTINPILKRDPFARLHGKAPGVTPLDIPLPFRAGLAYVNPALPPT
jgi:hypothetical protein